ncbi:tyrosine-protein phosphatase-like protein non-receptor [Trichodelitschia bisporula]|uniref:protein-tyrosine-phosphatase n=1 Tax=Trichodelitschia bisporula TaxID=703511 RepID=A0A6G1HJD9_9PEZI|nr:tyrosine-protein phosphatase-like protein non-receptor [Trichodelitschia bisporula]
MTSSAAASPLCESHFSPSLHSDARSPSPNYFGLKIDSTAEALTPGAGIHARTNWSPPTSMVRSTAAPSPRVIPLDQNPEFEAFRRQSEKHGFGAAMLAGFGAGMLGSPQPVNGASQSQSPTISRHMRPPSPRVNAPLAENYLSEPKQRSPKRMLSSPSVSVTDKPRRASPAGFTDKDSLHAPRYLTNGRDARYSLPPAPATPQSPMQSGYPRAETLPARGEAEERSSAQLVTPQYVVNLLEAAHEEILLLDLRVSTQYSRSRITGALNLCIPTTLLKRPSYDPQKLAETFKSDEQRRKFERWKSCKHIVVYDGFAQQLKDAAPCANMLKKFINEGWTGGSYIIRGGFAEFSKRFPHLVAHDEDVGTTPSAHGLSLGLGAPSLPPVIGGCPMPVSKSAANPFFGNIRQNMDLIGGVGQLPVKRPASLGQQQEDDLPQWLRAAADPKDNGKTISEKFLRIEKSEQKRMQDALSGRVVYGTPGAEVINPISIAGFEKGAKNRYNNIWPYEHSRVKLEGVRDDGCDYVNANHIKAAWSTRRYIATQGPIPATFNDFWNVVWQQDVRVVVMLTAETEGGQLKAHNYWDAKHYGPLTLTFLSEHRVSIEPSKILRRRERPGPTASGIRPRSGTNPLTDGGRSISDVSMTSAADAQSPSEQQAYVTVRRFTLEHSGEPFERIREITQLQYSNWPDFGAPAHPAHLLGLVEQVDAVVRASYGRSVRSASELPRADDPPRPIVVHCSAGCGRTGTFCTVDSVIEMLRHQRRERAQRSTQPQGRYDMAGGASRGQGVDGKEGEDWIMRDDVDLIQKTVEDLRLQRVSMVQSLRQFVLCYESVLEWLAAQTPKSA